MRTLRLFLMTSLLVPIAMPFALGTGVTERFPVQGQSDWVIRYGVPNHGVAEDLRVVLSGGNHLTVSRLFSRTPVVDFDVSFHAAAPHEVTRHFAQNPLTTRTHSIYIIGHNPSEDETQLTVAVHWRN